MICSELSIANPFINAVGTKGHEDVLFKTSRSGPGPGKGLAESGSWKKPGCSLQAGRHAASDRVDAVAGDCERRLRDGCANSSSDSWGWLHATSAGYRGPPERIRDRPGASCAGTRYAVWPDTPGDCKPLGRDGVWKVGRLAGNTGSSAAGKTVPPRIVWEPTFRKPDRSLPRR